MIGFLFVSQVFLLSGIGQSYALGPDAGRLPRGVLKSWLEDWQPITVETDVKAEI